MSIQFIGFDRAALKVRLLDPAVRKRIAGAIVVTTNEALAIARQLVPYDSGELAGTLRADISSSGMTGQVKAGYGNLPPKKKGESARTRRVRGAKEIGPRLPGSYAAIVEFGRRNGHAHPYLTPAAEGVRGVHAERVEAALEQGIDDVASGGSGVE